MKLNIDEIEKRCEMVRTSTRLTALEQDIPDLIKKIRDLKGELEEARAWAENFAVAAADNGAERDKYKAALDFIALQGCEGDGDGDDTCNVRGDCVTEYCLPCYAAAYIQPQYLSEKARQSLNPKDGKIKGVLASANHSCSDPECSTCQSLNPKEPKEGGEGWESQK